MQVPDSHTSDPILICGHGRSGTNWLLDVFDTSPETHCRNEPDLIEGTPFASLPSKWIEPDNLEFGERWDEAVAHASGRLGQIDHPVSWPKPYMRGWAARSGLYHLIVTKPKARRLLRPFVPRFREHLWEFVPPRWLAQPEAVREATTVVKLVQTPGWIRWVLRHRPNTRVVHIVRHPGGFLNSWTRRWLNNNERDQVVEANRRRLWHVAEAEPEWGQCWGDPDLMSGEESELWFWRYASETIERCGTGAASYIAVTFEQLADDPVGVTRSLFEHCGLGWDERVEHRVQTLSADSGKIADKWRSQLEGSEISLIERMLQDSPLHDWWRQPIAP